MIQKLSIILPKLAQKPKKIYNYVIENQLCFQDKNKHKKKHF